MPLSNPPPIERQPIPGMAIRGALGFALVFILLYGWMLSSSILHADAAEYLDDMQSLNQIEHPVHFGYILTGNLFLKTVFFTSDTDWVINAFNLIWGAASLFFLYLIAFHLTGKISVSTIACLVLGVNYTFVFNSLFAEVYIMQVACLLIALYTHLRERFVIAAIFFSLSVLTSPLSIMAAPLFIAVQFRAKPILIFTAITAIPLSLLVWLNPDYLHSGRFTMSMNEQFLIQRQAMIEFNEISNGYFMMAPALVAGCFVLYRTRHLKRFNLGLLLVFLINFFLGERYYDVPGQLLVYSLLSIAAAAGLAVLLGKSDAKVNAPTFYWWATGVAFASLIGALLTGWSIKIQQGMTEIPFFYIKAGIGVLFSWLLFASISRYISNEKDFIRQFAAVGLVGILLLFNWRFTYNRTRENKWLAERKKEEFNQSLKVCPQCIIIANWNDVQLYRHYRMNIDESMETTGIIVTQDDSSFTSSREKADAVAKIAAEGKPFLVSDEFPFVAKWLTDLGYSKQALPGWYIFIRNAPLSSLQMPVGNRVSNGR